MLAIRALGDNVAGRFVDPTRAQPIAQRGAHFAVHGPLNLPRTPQGHSVLVLVLAGTSDDGRESASRHAEAVISASQSFEESLAYSRTA